MAMGFKTWAGRQTASDYNDIAKGLKNFTPYRYTNLYGTSTYGPSGMTFDPTADFAKIQGQTGDFWGNALSNLNSFNQGDSAAKTLELLRQQNATYQGAQQSRLESRLLGQGRLGLGTGEMAANPEMQGFFSSAALQDLAAQLQAQQEARNQGSYLFNMAAGAGNMYNAVADPNAPNMFQMAGLLQQRDLFGAGLQGQGAAAKGQAYLSGANDIHQFGQTAWQGFTNMWSGGGMMSNPMGSK